MPIHMELDGVMNREMFRGFHLCRHAMLLSRIKKAARDKSVAGRNSQKAVLACKPESYKVRGTNRSAIRDGIKKPRGMRTRGFYSGSKYLSF